MKCRSESIVSVIIPIYNSEKLLDKCIQSILNQTFKNIECILVDDFSSDGSREICNYYANIDARIKLIPNDRHYGSSQSREIGFKRSCGEYIQFVDSDDWIEADMIQKMYSKAIDERLDIVFCDYYEEKNNEIFYKKQEIEIEKKLEILKYMAAYDEKINCSLWNKLTKADILEKVKFPIESYSEDMFISTQIMYFCKKIGYLNEALYHYVYNADSLCYNKQYEEKRILENYNICVLIHDFLHEKFGDNLDLFEPEISRRFNTAKKRFLQIGERR